MDGAIMVDIDWTILDPISGTVNLKVLDIIWHYRLQGFKIIVVTARPLWLFKYTKSQLESNFVYFDELHCVNRYFKGFHKLVSNYNYVLSIGDNDSDLTHSAMSIKVC